MINYLQNSQNYFTYCKQRIEDDEHNFQASVNFPHTFCFTLTRQLKGRENRREVEFKASAEKRFSF